MTRPNTRHPHRIAAARSERIAPPHRSPRGSRLRRALLLAGTLALVAAPLAALAGNAPPIKWHQGVDWVPFDQALTRAKAENKAVCVVIYADWCPKCRALAPRFAEQPVTGASKDVIMVLQNSDERPGWLKQRFGDLGNYVPRVFFLKPDGTVATDINSGNARFPYFYRASEAAKLAASIQRAAKAAGPAAAPVPKAPPPAAPAAAAPAAPVAPAAAATGSGSIAGGSDVPIMILLALVAVAAVWFVGRGSNDEAGDA